ncbi:MAG: Asp-tRNA(Asn)/Glu-tRNA(Gln) amidotransferase subunit GatA, partial [Deltaproteobacteria bacterium]|nr:Asp-tRNA(Asn)/Glu-tRNA(Gln) amidotransferase subunit GatA [Deltaproteobacteria bacterium]
MNLERLGVEELLAALDARECEARDVVEACRGAAARLDPTLHLFTSRVEDPQIPTELGPLAGIPYVTKANIAVEGQPLTCASRILQSYRPPYDATVTARLRHAGAVLLGHTNMDEFAMGSSTENSATQPTRNPWDPTRTPGGSSGGSAAAVAAGVVPFALGSDTGGSIRQPAGFCGAVGLKPTYGRVSRFGLVAFASSLDQIGPITRSVRDAALVYRVLAGHDPRDSTSLDAPVEDPLEGIESGPKGLRLGVPRALLAEGLDREVADNLEAVLARLEADGATLVDVEIPQPDVAVATYYVLATAEASSNLARYDGVRYGSRQASPSLEEMVRGTRTAGFGREVKLRILLGTYVLSAGYYDAYYRKASQVRTLMRRQSEAALESCDAILT